MDAGVTAVDRRNPKAHYATGGKLTRLDKRTSAGRRIKQLTAQYLAELDGSAAADPAVVAKVRRAAELVVLAENARAMVLRGAFGIDALVRIERLAELAVSRLGNGPKPDS